MAKRATSKPRRGAPLLKALRRMGYRATLNSDGLSTAEAKVDTRRYARALPIIRELRATGYDVLDTHRSPLYT